MDGGGGYTTMRMYLIPLNCTLKNGSDRKFYIICILPQFVCVCRQTNKKKYLEGCSGEEVSGLEEFLKVL